MENIIFKHIQTYSTEAGNLNSFTPVQEEQIKICAELYFGEGNIESIENIFDEEQEGWIEADLYHVIDVDKQEVILDFWNYMADSGTFFAHNTANYAGYEMIQFSIDFIAKNEVNEHFPEDFEKTLKKKYNECK
ncbi:hypothetical protein AD998_19960 [bacterium 336/3]|nr:hypothetical protein AD998_19960 [bacterium 336/3]